MRSSPKSASIYKTETEVEKSKDFRLGEKKPVLTTRRALNKGATAVQHSIMFFSSDLI
jgi:hypothetical protein